VPLAPSLAMVRYPRIVKVDDRLFEGEEAVLHVIERIVAPLGLRTGGSHTDIVQITRIDQAVMCRTSQGQELETSRVPPLPLNRRLRPGL
jgi:hypothetical protein